MSLFWDLVFFHMTDVANTSDPLGQSCDYEETEGKRFSPIYPEECHLDKEDWETVGFDLIGAWLME